MSLPTTFSEKFRSPLQDSAIVQAVLIGLASLAVCNDGMLLSICIIPAVAYWAAVLIYVMRFPSRPSPGILFRLRWGYFFFLILTLVICGFIRRH